MSDPFLTGTDWTGARMYRGARLKVKCSDGAERVATLTAESADTFFSYPARVQVSGRTLTFVEPWYNVMHNYYEEVSMFGYIYAADVWCEECGQAIGHTILAETGALGNSAPGGEMEYGAQLYPDSDQFPVICNMHECEADSIAHCASGADCLSKLDLAPYGCPENYSEGAASRYVGRWLENPLTNAGVSYTRELIIGTEEPSEYQRALHAFWRESYPEHDFPDDDEATDEPGDEFEIIPGENAPVRNVARYLIVLDRMNDDESVGHDGHDEHDEHWPVDDREGMEQVARELQEAMEVTGQPAGFFRVIDREERSYDESSVPHTADEELLRRQVRARLND